MSVWDSIKEAGSTAMDALGTVPIVGNAIHGAEALGHGAVGAYDYLTGDTNGAKAEFSAAGNDGLKAIPFLGNAMSAWDLVEKTAGGSKEGFYEGAAREGVEWLMRDKPAEAPAAAKPSAPSASEQEKADKARYQQNVADREAQEHRNEQRAKEKLEGQKMRQAAWMRANPGAKAPPLSEF
jgi:hypothetical protein